MQNKKQTLQAIKRWLITPSVVDISMANNKEYNRIETPPMGWSSRKVFAGDISCEKLQEIAKAMSDKGLIESGYNMINIDDGWQSVQRTHEDAITADKSKFPNGITDFICNCNKLGASVGLYAACGDSSKLGLIGSQFHEVDDAITIAKSGVSRLNYNFSNHRYASVIAPVISGINVQLSSEKCGKRSQDEHAKNIIESIDNNCVKSEWLDLSKGEVIGLAKVKENKAEDGKYLVVGLSKSNGSFSIKYNAEICGEYDIYIVVKANHGREKMIVVAADDIEYKIINEPVHEKGISTYCLSAKLHLVKGENTLTFTNPVRTKKDSVKLYYNRMATALKKVANDISIENNASKPPIIYAICDNGKSKPHQWAKGVCNSWETTRSITNKWERIKRVYVKNSALYAYASVDGWNDPDILEVGNGKLTSVQNKAHFSLWCMMNAPLILGTDVRYISDSLLEIVTNKQMIAINQDRLGKQAKVVRKGAIDMIAKPLSGGDIAVCIFNKTSVKGFYNFSLASLIKDAYVQLPNSSSYTAREVWSNRDQTVTKSLCGSIDKDDVHVFILSAK